MSNFLNFIIDYKYLLIAAGFFLIIGIYNGTHDDVVYQNTMIDSSKPTYSAEGRIYEGGEVLGEVQKINGEWKGLLYDKQGNEFWIMEMEQKSDNTWYAYGLEGNMFIISIY